MGWMKNETGLEKCTANYTPLTPLSFLQRAANVFPDHPAVVYGDIRRNYREYAERVSRLASALVKLGIKPGDVVATMIPNLPPQAEAHFGVPACAGVLNAINTRIESDTVAYILDHGEAKVILVDSQFLPEMTKAIEKMEGAAPIIIEVADPQSSTAASGEHMEYEELLATGDADFAWIMPQDEWESIALNYTSGTTGRPKGVVYHHRGAHLSAMAQTVSWQMALHPRYLSIVPLFHCNAWCHAWMLPLVGGTMVCCRDIAARPIFDAIADEKITHFAGAPIVLNTLANAPPAQRREFDHIVNVFTAGAPPAPSTLARIEPMGFNITHVYGLTETYGPAIECTWKSEWESLEVEARATIKSRQGVTMPFMEKAAIWDDKGQPVPMDGKTPGEIVFRGNGVMKGYLKNPKATEEAFAGGWYHSGDIAVQHPDTYLQISDRAKDIIISGGENISSVEVEGVLMGHPDVSLCAVVAKPDEKWGEVPCAFVELKEGATENAEALIAYAREKLAGFKTPKSVVFQELPKTSTGKIQKFELRTLARTL